MAETRKRYTMPRWKRAHYIYEYGLLGAIVLWATECQRSFDLPDPEADDPVEAPAEMPMCETCVENVAKEGGTGG